MKEYIVVLLLIPLLSQGQTTILTGWVNDPVAGIPVENATARIYLGSGQGELSATTGPDGRFKLQYDELLFDKDYSIVIQKENYHKLNGFVRLNYGEGPDRRFNLYRKKIPEPKVVIKDVAPTPSLLGAPTSNLIFLIDVSGSMAEQDRLADLKESLLFLVELYRPEDQLSIIAYSTGVDVLLEGGRISELEEIKAIIRQLSPTGRTEGVAGLAGAYDLATTLYLEDGNNKVILATDGIFGEDKKSRKLVEETIIQGRSRDVSLSIFSFGQEAAAVSERLSAWSVLGRGHHTHITSLQEAKNQIVKEARGE
jgi:hypothetical protein